MITTRAALFGTVAALISPWHLAGIRLKRLLDAAADGDPPRLALDAARADAALRSANRMLRMLSRVPAGPWQNTCLYRAVAGCLALRWLGEHAIVRIGARRPPNGDLQAHAWIEGFTDEHDGDGEYQILSARARMQS